MSEKILILGAGGREHAMAHKLSTEGVGHEVIVAPGNPGIEKISSVKCHKLNVSHHEEVIKFSKEKQFDLIIVGPEAPLAAGLGDELRNEGFLVVGPGKIGAKLESSKAFSKDFMYRHGIPTAQYGSYTEIEKALSDVKTEKFGTNPVIKASGLAAGKGVFVCKDLDEAKTSVERLMGEESFSIKSPEIVIEEQLFGNELSVFALVDESGYKIIGHGEDYKRLEDNDLGPNTGGMGAVFRKGIISQELLQKIQSDVLDNFVKGLKTDGIEFRGILFIGLMISKESVNVIEFNVRMGDPETQVLFPMVESELAPYFIATAKGELTKVSDEIKHKEGFGVHIVKASQGYPGTFGEKLDTGHSIEINQKDLEDLKKSNDLYLTFSGVKDSENQSELSLMNSGGRVLGLTAIAETLDDARNSCYQKLEGIEFKNNIFRKDIGLKRGSLLDL